MHTKYEKKQYALELIKKLEGCASEDEKILAAVATGMKLSNDAHTDKKAS